MSARDDLTLETDASGNLTVTFKEPSDPGSPVYFTASGPPSIRR